jgi:hypothetical protein
MERTEQLQDFYNANPWADVMANDQMILNKAAADKCTLEDAASALGNSLLIAAPFKEAWSQFLQKYPMYDHVMANKLVAFHNLPEFELHPTPEMFEEIAERGVLAMSNAYTQEHAEQRERQDLLQAITRGRSSYESFNKWNIRTVFQSKDLQSLSLDDLRALATKVEGERNLRALPKEQRRATTKKASAYQEPAVRQLPPHYTCTVESRWFQVGQTVELTKFAFLQMGRDDQRILLNKYGIPAINVLLGVQQ